MKVYRSRKSGEKIIETYDRLLSLWNCEIKERDIETKYGITHVIECGDEALEPLVLFHGVGDDSALMWIFNAPYLSQHYHVFAIDTMGGPGKSRPNSNYNKEFDDILWIDEVLGGIGIDRSRFAGVSMGGYLVQAYSLKRPERVIHAISIAWAVPVEKHLSNGDKLKALTATFLPEALFPTKKNIYGLIRKLSGKNYRVFTENSDIMEHYGWLIKGFNNGSMRNHKIMTFTTEEADSIRDKVTYLVGNDDPFQKFGGRQALIDNNMNTEFYDGAGHGLNHEFADEINKRIIEEFMK
ncbi:MAG: alpha/beta hydrolase [Aeriscardovia sp.]|nr:alpha/beta hydrolase [Aeriscardovia sp.]MBR3462684.1 alpha/beta hydrolase [Clostridiales bacterium]